MALQTDTKTWEEYKNIRQTVKQKWKKGRKVTHECCFEVL